MEHEIRRVAVIGAGVMGRGIAALMLELCQQVWLFDQRTEALQQAQQSLQARADQLAQPADFYLAQNLAELSGCDLVIEAIAEDLEAKRSLFKALELYLPESCIFASNTSSLSITAIASACSHPQRLLGLHFFNPVAKLRLIELIPALQTSSTALTTVQNLFAASSHQLLLASDSPGFIVNHAGRGYGLEALRIWQEQVAEPAQIDTIMRAAGFKLGPFELFDLVGLDVSLPVMQAIYQQYYHEARYQPSVLLAKRIYAGWLGRKSGRGFYSYDANGRKLAQSNSTVQTAEVAGAWQRPIWFDPHDAEAARYLPDLLFRAGIAASVIESQARPSQDALILLTPQGEDCSTVAARAGLDASRCLALDSWLSPDHVVVLMANPATEAQLLSEFDAHLRLAGLQTVQLRDSAGLVFQRIIANIINIAAEMALQGIASPAEIDQAVQLGLAYPAGPLTWGDRLGLARLCQVLRQMQAVTGETRYRPSLWLQRRAQLGLSLLHDGK